MKIRSPVVPGSGIRFLPALALLTAGVLLLPGLLRGQSLLGTQGLGFPLEAMDARSRALGSVGTGLFGGSLSPLDPASATGLAIPTANLTFQPTWGESTMNGETLDGQATRFPLIGLAYPVGPLRAMVSLTLGGVMDQRWEVSYKGEESLGNETVPVTNKYSSDGGISSLRLGWAQLIGRRLSLAVGVGANTGSVTRSFSRTFDSLYVGSSFVAPFVDGGKWRYQGITGSVGAVWDPLDVLRVSGSVTFNGDLEAEPSDETTGAKATFSLPTEFRFGASGVLTPRVDLNLGVSYAEWESSARGLLPGAVVGGIWSVGGGVEWELNGMGGRTIPLRLGMRRSELPFTLDGADPVETTYAGGLGVNLTQADQFVLAGVDLAVESGTREAGSFSEDFWRGTITFRVSGW